MVFGLVEGRRKTTQQQFLNKELFQVKGPKCFSLRQALHLPGARQSKGTGHEHQERRFLCSG